MLTRRIQKYIEENKLLQPGDRVIVAVSGGPDSMALLHIMHSLSPVMDFEIIAAHLNHGLREAAADEENLVINSCQTMGISCFSRKVSVARLAREQKMTLEDAGRNARYSYFNELREELDAQKIATAHHHDDVAETVLLHLLRGAGIKGLRGILPIQGPLIRPLLTVSKEDLKDYLVQENIPYCLDHSNDDVYYLRNRIRHGLIPYLQAEFNPRIVGKLNQLALIARDENAVLEEECSQHWCRIVEHEEDGTLVLNNKALILLHRAYQRRIILMAFGRLAGESGWSLEDVEKVLDLSLKPGSSLTLHLKKKVRVNKSYDRIIFTTRLQDRATYSYKISVPGRVDILETGSAYLISQIERKELRPEPGDTYLDYELLPALLYLRSRQEGDVFRPPGMSGSKKMKKVFIDHKVPYYERDQMPLLAGPDHEIYAALGLGVSRLAAVNSDTRFILLIKNLK
jgi:tRNA(Ile)-lysidine synthase